MSRAHAVALTALAVFVHGFTACDPDEKPKKQPPTTAPTLAAAPCKPTLPSDGYTGEGINMRTGCMVVAMTLGSVAGAVDLSLPVALIRNEGVAPPAALYPKAWFGLGTWLSVDEWVSDDSTSNDDLKFTLHTPNGDVLYDTMVRAPYAEFDQSDPGDDSKIGLRTWFRSKPFDGTLLRKTGTGYIVRAGNPGDTRSLTKEYEEPFPGADPKKSFHRLLSAYAKASIYRGQPNFIDIERNYVEGAVSVKFKSSLFDGTKHTPLVIEAGLGRTDGEAGSMIEATTTLLHGWSSAVRTFVDERGNVDSVVSSGRKEGESHTSTFTYWNEKTPASTVFATIVETEGAEDDARVVKSLEITERADGKSPSWPFAVKTLVNHSRPNADRTHVVSECDMKVEIKTNPGELKSTLLATQKAGFRVESLTRPGRQGDDLLTFGWEDALLKSRDVQTRDAAMKTTFQSTSTIARADGAPTVASITRSDKILGIGRGDETTYFETCDADGAAFEGTTVTLPRNVRTSFEYGDETQQHRLLAMTSPLGVRTQYLYNDKNTEPRGELTDVAALPGKTEPAMIGTGAGTHVDFEWVTQNAIEASLYPNDTFVGPKTSQGVPVPKEVKRLPDGMPLQKLSQYDKSVFLPTSIVDERGFKHVMSFYSDTAQLKSYTRRGITTSHKRTFEIPAVLNPGYTPHYFFLAIETLVQGAGAPVTISKTYWDHGGRLYSDVRNGLQFDANAIGSGQTRPIRIEKVFARSTFMKPSKLQTWVDKKLLAETLVEWDPRLRGPASASSTAGGSAVSGAGPVQGKGKVDGLGTAVGSWEITAMGQKLSVTTELDPLGNILSSSVNGLGARISYAAGPMGSIKVSTALVGPNGEAPLGETVETSGETEKVCMP